MDAANKRAGPAVGAPAAGGPRPDEPVLHALQPLSPRERAIVRLAAAGLGNRAIADHLDISKSSAASHLRNAAGKLGVRNVAELLSMVQGRRNLATLPGSRRLTEAEGRVVRAALAGRSNAEIARLRGTSTRTVANQLGSAFRKLGVTSRRQLWARFAQLEAERHRGSR